MKEQEERGGGAWQTPSLRKGQRKEGFASVTEKVHGMESLRGLGDRRKEEARVWESVRLQLDPEQEGLTD